MQNHKTNTFKHIYLLTDSQPTFPTLDPNKKLVVQQLFRKGFSNRREKRTLEISPAMQQAKKIGNSLKNLI